MAEVSIRQAKKHLFLLLARAVAGEEIVIAKAGKPIARLVPYDDSAKPRVPGQDKGSRFYIADDFDAPLPEEFLIGPDA